MKRSLLIFFMLSVGYSHAAHYECSVAQSFPIKDTVFGINSIISVGNDVPVGTVVYRARFMQGPMGIDCKPVDDSGYNQRVDLPHVVDFFSTPTSVVTGITEPNVGEKVFVTNIPGIGVSIRLNGKMPFTDTVAYNSYTKPNSWATNQSIDVMYDVALIKTGPVTPGSVNASNFPTLLTTFISPPAPTGNTFSGFPFPHSKVSFQGTVQITQSTCRIETADKLVEMGSYPLKNLISDSNYGRVTEWKNASLRLTGCQFSPGFYNNNNASIYVHMEGGASAGIPDKNTVKLSLRTLTSLIDPIKGIIALAPEPDSASGVGIQIGVKKNNNTWIDPFNFSTNEAIFPPASPQDQWIDIPIFARYIVTGNPVTPGKANAAVVYTLDYL